MLYKKVVLTILLLTFSHSIFAQKNLTETMEKIEVYMQRNVEVGFSGALLLAKDGHVILSKGYGLADRKQNIPNTHETVFTTGSVTKQFTGAAILKLQMMGKLNTQDLMSKYLKGVPDDKKSITIHHLLTHSAGFPGAIGDDYDPVERDAFIKLAMETKLERPPGELYEYSNVGYSLLGAIIEIVSDQNYEAFLRQNLFLPSGMKTTGYLLPDWDSVQFAQGYRGENHWGTLRDHPWASDGPGWHLRANGGILSTVEDMYKWHVALKGTDILDDDAKTLFYHPHVTEGENADSHYGYGWAIFTTHRNTKLVAHNGGNRIFSADFLRYIDEDVVIIGMANSSENPVFRITETVARIMFGESYTLPMRESKVFSSEELKIMPEGKRALGFLDHFASDDRKAIRQFLNKNVAPKTLNKNGIDNLINFMTQEDRPLGKVSFNKAIQSEENSLGLIVQSNDSGQWWKVTLHFEKEKPHRINGINIEDTQPPATDQESELDDYRSEWGLPDSNTGRMAAAILELFFRQDQSFTRSFMNNFLAPTYLEALTSDGFLKRVKEWQSQIGEFELMGAGKSGPFSARLRLHSDKAEKQFLIKFKLDPKNDSRLIHLDVQSE